MMKPVPVRPMWTDSDIDGKPLFETDRARSLVDQARALAEKVHGGSRLTFPPDEM